MTQLWVGRGAPIGKREVGDFSTNPHAWIARFGICGGHNFYANWAIAHGALEDWEPEAPHVSDVLNSETLSALPRRHNLRHGKVLRNGH